MTPGDGDTQPEGELVGLELAGRRGRGGGVHGGSQGTSVRRVVGKLGADAIQGRAATCRPAACARRPACATAWTALMVAPRRTRRSTMSSSTAPVRSTRVEPDVVEGHVGERHVVEHDVGQPAAGEIESVHPTAPDHRPVRGRRCAARRGRARSRRRSRHGGGRRRGRRHRGGNAGTSRAAAPRTPAR